MSTDNLNGAGYDASIGACYYAELDDLSRARLEVGRPVVIRLTFHYPRIHGTVATTSHVRPRLPDEQGSGISDPRRIHELGCTTDSDG